MNLDDNHKKKYTINPVHHKGLTLRLLNESDLPHTLGWRNHYKAWFLNDHDIDYKSHLKWYHAYCLKDDDFIFIIESDGHRIGQLAIYQMDLIKKSGEFGRFMVNPSFAGNGLMSQALEAGLHIANDIFHLTHIYLNVKNNNLVAISIYKKHGFYTTNTSQDNIMRMELVL